MSRIDILNSKKKQKESKEDKKVVFAAFGILFLAAGLTIFINSSKNLIQPKAESSVFVQIKETDASFRQFGIKIEKIGTLAPIIRDVDSAQKTIYNRALENGVAHYKGTAVPGGGNNIFIYGHSSIAVGSGFYTEIFSKLNQLQTGDEIIVLYQEKEFKYSVFEKGVIEKDDFSVLKPTPKEQLTLMTCWPIGTKDKRLIIKAAPVPKEP